MSTQLGTNPVLSECDTDDDDNLAHVARREDIVRSSVTGEPLTALCGFRMVSRRDPSRLPVCPRCTEIMRGIRAGRSGVN